MSENNKAENKSVLEEKEQLETVKTSEEKSILEEDTKNKENKKKVDAKNDDGFFGGVFDDDELKPKPYVNKISTILGLLGFAICGISLFSLRYLSVVGLSLGIAGLVLEFVFEKKKKKYDAQAFMYSLGTIIIGLIAFVLFLVSRLK